MLDLSNSVMHMNGRVSIGGQAVACDSFEGFFGMNEMPYAKVVLIPVIDTNGLPESYVDIYSILESAGVGATVVVSFTLSGQPRDDLADVTADDLTMFEGVLDAWGCVQIGGVMQLHAWLSHWLKPLMTIKAVTPMINGVNMCDNLLPSIARDQEALVSMSYGKYTASSIASDIWDKLIKPEFINIASETQGGSQIVSELFKRDESELPLSISGLSNKAGILLDIRRTLYTTEDDEVSLWDKLMRLAARYKFSVIPRVNDFSVAPCTYIVGGGIDDVVIRDEYFSQLQDTCALKREGAEILELFENVSSMPVLFDRSGRRRNVATYTEGAVIADPLLMQSPPWAYNTAPRTAETMGLVNTKLFAAGYSVKKAPDAITSSVNEDYNALTNDSQKFAETVFLDRLYRDRTAIIRGPLFFDFSPGSTILMETPRSVEPPDDSVRRVTYGCVRRVCVALTGSAKRSGTWLVISHLRSEKEQQNLKLSQHPMYGQRWVRAPLLKYSGLVRDQVMG